MNNYTCKNKNYKINLHILEACNYKCKHCFAHFYSKKTLKEEDWEKIVDNCINSINVSAFNIAGGEPLLYKDLSRLIKYIYNKNCLVSIITNGFLMNEEWIKENVKYLDTIGFSIDSFDKEILLNIGRKTKNNEILTKEQLDNLIFLIRYYNPECKIKINTVVNSLNYNENMSNIIESMKINRWKILKMKVYKQGNFDNSSLQISSKQFNKFLNINNNIDNIIIEKTLKNSYIFIDSNGILLDNSNDYHTNIINVLEEDFKKGFDKLILNEELYFSRYK